MEFTAIRASRTYKQINNAPPAIVFPLLCPVREKDWIDGWDYKMIYSESGLVEQGCIFSTPHHGNQQTIWYVSRHDKENYKVEFIRLTPGEEVVKINILLEDNRDGTTTSSITYEYTGLSETRDAWIRESLDDEFKKSMIWWEKAINHYIATGKKLMK